MRHNGLGQRAQYNFAGTLRTIASTAAHFRDAGTQFDRQNFVVFHSRLLRTIAQALSDHAHALVALEEAAAAWVEKTYLG
jgi:hypothetical protein